MGKEKPEDLNNLLHEVDSFLEEVDEEQPSLEGGETTIGNLAGREKLIRELFQETEPSLNGAVELHVSEDEMQVSLDCYPPQGQGELISPKVVESQLVDKEISYGIDWDTIQKTLFTCNTERRQISGVIIARGKTASPEIPEHLLLRKDLIKPTEEKPPKEEPQDKRAQIDYRKRSPFTIVEKEEVLAKLKRKKRGASGTP
ncbi:MAG: flagellar assembly protein A [Spirochaetia bacterium]|nr:flagellar assembly protein A [Spirochaetia bacterium]